MKKIIGGKKYDTDTATCIDSYSEGMGNDFDYIEETLYQKKNGSFFLVGDGGARSCYSRECEGGGFVGATVIVPLDEDEAKDWVAEHSSVEVYEGLFGPVEE